MLKTLTLSLSLAVALGVCSVSKAGGFHATEQGYAPSPQAPIPSAQSECVYPEKKCGLGLGDKLHGLGCGLGDCFSGIGCGIKGAGHKLNCGLTDLCTKLKPKPHVYTYEWVLKKKRVHGHHAAPCETAGVYPSGQVAPSGQAAPYSSGQAASYGSGQYAETSMGQMTPAAPAGGDEAPPAPEVAPTAPKVPSAPPAPPVPTPPPVPGATSSLLFSTPSGN